MNLWAFRFLLWYICVLFTQPQNRFYFLHPFHIADLCVLGAMGLHVFSAMTEGKPILRIGPATRIGIVLVALAFLSQYMGAYQTSSHWSTYIDRLAKAVLLMVLVEAMTDSVPRAWAVLMTMMLGCLWWIKGGMRLSAVGATFSGDRIMGPAVSIVENPNGFAYMLCVMVPIFLYLMERSSKITYKILYIILALSSVYIVLQTGSRTGFIVLMALGFLVVFRYFRSHKMAMISLMLGAYLLMGYISPGNIRRFKTIPESIISALTGTVKSYDRLNQDEESAQTRHLKNKDTWRLIKDNPVLGAGMRPNAALYAEEYPFATGQVHCEILMAGRQMGIPGMVVYASLLYLIVSRGWKIQRQYRYVWPDLSRLGWCLFLQGILTVVGGSFAPLPWNPVMLILAGTASSVWVVILEERQEIDRSVGAL